MSKLTPTKRQKRGTALALVGACLHATVTDIKSRASSLPQKAAGAVVSKLTPTESKSHTEQSGAAQALVGACLHATPHASWSRASSLLQKGKSAVRLRPSWERACTRCLMHHGREQARSYRKAKAQCGFGHRGSVLARDASALVGACLHATPHASWSRASSLLQKGKSAVRLRLLWERACTRQLPLSWERACTRRFGSCGSVLARDASCIMVASKLAPTSPGSYRSRHASGHSGDSDANIAPPRQGQSFHCSHSRARTGLSST